MKLQNVFRLGYRHKTFLLRCLLVVTVVRIGLTFSSYRNVAKHIRLDRASSVSPRSPYLIAWAVRNTARLVPLAHCLTQALSAQYLLARQGSVGTVRVGVKQHEGKFEAHAWLLHDDIVILGGYDHTLADYSIIADLKPVSK